MIAPKLCVFVFFLLVASAFAARKPKLRGDLFKGDQFVPIERFTDEFRGSFDYDKWIDYNPRWRGRQPGLFATKNVQQKRGKLLLKGRAEGPDSDAFDGAPDGYEGFTTSFVQSTRSARYGYYEVKAKPGNSRLSSAFWGSLDTPTKWTEIDVFEIGGGAQNKGIDFRRQINMNLHVFRDVKRGISPGVNEMSKPTYYIHNRFLRSRFNVYGLDWSKKFITWTFNGKVIRQDRNTRWKQRFPIKFDVETMPNWFGLPSVETLPATYKLKYIRTWSRRKTADSVSTVRTAARNTVLEQSSRQLQNMFGIGSFGSQGADEPMSVGDNQDEDEDEDEDDDEGDDDSAEVEISPIEPQTDAPQDGLQRPPIPGSNEVVYRPVLPTLGRTWTEMIASQNSVLDDIAGAQFAPGEDINLADFDEELTLFPGQSRGPAAAPDDPESEPDSPPSSAPAAPEAAPAAAPATAPMSATPASNQESPLGGLLSSFNFGR